MGHLHTEAETSTDRRDPATSLDRRAMLRRLAATGAVAWAAPEILATKRASAMALSGCYLDYDFDDGTLQGWTTSGSGPAGWQVSSLHAHTGTHSAWFGRAGSTNSLHPVSGQPSFHQNNRSSRGTLRSPATTASSTDVICFHVRLAIENATSYDVFRLFILQGSTRVQLWDKHQPGFTVIDHPENTGAQWDLYTTNGSWVEVDVPIGTPAGINLDNPLQFEFDFQTVDAQYNRTEGIYLDNIMIPCGSAGGSVIVSNRSQGSAGAGLSLDDPVRAAQNGVGPPPEITAAPADR